MQGLGWVEGRFRVGLGFAGALSVGLVQFMGAWSPGFRAYRPKGSSGFGAGLGLVFWV